MLTRAASRRFTDEIASGMLRAMNRAELPPSAAVLRLVAGRWISAAISLVAKLGVADELASGPKTSEQIAQAVGANASAVRRVLRMLASVGVFTFDGENTFGITPLSDTLRNTPGSMRAMAMMIGERPMTRAWDELEHAVRTGEPAFTKVHGMHLFDFFAQDPGFAGIFNDAMTSRSSFEVEAVLAAFDFSSVGKLVDVAGGKGLLLASVLAKNPGQRGVLFDLPIVIEGASPILESKGVADRCELVGGSFFDRIPEGADGYMMKHILHDWNDEDSIRILRNIHAACKPSSRVFVLDAVIAPDNAPNFAKLLDVQMLVATPSGYERTLPEWEKLFAAGGFKLSRVVETRGPVAVLEGTRS